MTTLGLTMAGRRRKAQSARSNSIMQQGLLVCGILSSLLYVVTDILGGLRYDGYNFSSQAISELMAVGSPSEAFVDPLFVMYGVLAVAFGVGVIREGAGARRLLIVG